MGTYLLHCPLCDPGGGLCISLMPFFSEHLRQQTCYLVVHGLETAVVRKYDSRMIEGDGRGLNGADEGDDCGLEFVVLVRTGGVDVNRICGVQSGI